MKPFLHLPAPLPADASGIVSWAHIGDLHLVDAEQQNYHDLQRIVDRLNGEFAARLNFVFLPGDNAEHGKPEEYALVRSALDRLQLPWFSIIGDHDVHTRGFEAYHAAMLPEPHYRFDLGGYRFIALNAFSVPAPDSFVLDEEQLAFTREALADAAGSGMQSVLFLHCYPSDLKSGYAPLRELLAQYKPLLVDMGHTHYNELACDAATLYSTTRSTGQIEEGPVGFSITNIDRGSVSWKFKELAAPDPFVMITAPADRRLTVPGKPSGSPAAVVRAKVWSTAAVTDVHLVTEGADPIAMTRVPETNVWQIAASSAVQNARRLRVTATTERGETGSDTVELSLPGEPATPAERDQDNAIEAWPERGILGTQLGPNKNGRKW